MPDARVTALSLWAASKRKIEGADAQAMALAPILERLGADAPADALRSRLRCTVCGERRASITLPSWKDIGSGLAKLPRERMPEWAQAWDCAKCAR